MSSIIACEIVALETPKVIRDCPKCNKNTSFYCSDKFRVNAQQKHIDIWLIYKCVQCDSTWNCPILSRVRVHTINDELLHAFTNNDRETAWSYAFQIDRLRKICSSVDTNIKYKMVSGPINLAHGDVTIRISSPLKFDLRLDKLLTVLLGISRSRLYRMAECGGIETKPQGSIKQKIKGELEVLVKAGIDM